MREYGVLEDVVTDQKRYFTSSMFPPNDEEIQKFHLERWYISCIKICQDFKCKTSSP